MLPRFRLLLCLIVLASFGAIGPLRAGIEPGAPLTLLLEMLQRRGLSVVYSSQLVHDDMKVTTRIEGEPTIEQVRLELERHGLQLVELSAGVFSVSAAPVSRFSVHGRVLSATDGQPIAGATITLKGPKPRTTTTDERGAFVVDQLTAGRQRLTIEAPHTRTYEGTVDLGAVGQPVVTLEVRLGPATEWLDEVDVSPDRYDLAANDPDQSRRIDSSQLAERPLRLGDTFSAIDALPGVAIGSEEAAPHIRGSLERDVAVIVDGLELYEPYHFSEFRSPASLIDPEAISDVEVHTGGMPVQFGDRFGGVVQIETPGSPREQHGAVALGTTNARLSFQGPLGASTFGSITARAWSPNLAFRTVDVGDEDVNPRLYDLFGKLQWTLSPRTILSAHAIGAADRIEFTAREKDSSAHATERNRFAWLRAQHRSDNGSESETVFGIGRVDRVRRGDFRSESGEQAETEDFRAVQSLTLTQHWIHPLGDTHQLSAGVDLRHLSARYDYRSLRTNAAGEATRMVALEPEGNSAGVYLADRFRLGARVVAQLGLRWDRQGHVDDSQLSPRLHLSWRLNSGGVWRAALGRYVQSQRIHELEVEDGVQKFQPAQRSDQLSVAWERRSAHGWETRVGLYARRLSSLRPRFENLFNVIELLPEAERDRVRIDAPRARAHGLEFSLESPVGESRLSGGIVYSYSFAEDRDQGRWVPRSWDQRHALSGHLTLQLGSQWRASLAAFAHSGWPITPPEVARDLGGVAGDAHTVSSALRNSERLPDYFRLDARLSYLKSWQRSSFGLDLSFINLTDRKNICCLDVIVLEGLPLRVEQNTWTRIAPTLTLLYRF